MIDKFSLTVGTPVSVKYVMDHYSDRKLLFFKNNQRDRYMIMDVSGGKQVLTSDLHFNTTYDNGGDSQAWDGFFELRYVTLDKDAQKVFRALLRDWENPDSRPAGLKRTLVGQKKHPKFQFLMVNVWDSVGSFLAWDSLPEEKNKFKQFEYNGGPGAIVKQYSQFTKEEMKVEIEERMAEEKDKDLEDWNKDFDN